MLQKPRYLITDINRTSQARNTDNDNLFLFTAIGRFMKPAHTKKIITDELQFPVIHHKAVFPADFIHHLSGHIQISLIHLRQICIKIRHFDPILCTVIHGSDMQHKHLEKFRRI
jgi:hypothetical protein